MKASKTLTTTLAAAALVGAISLAYAQTAQEPVDPNSMPVAEQIQPQVQAQEAALKRADVQAPRATDVQPADTLQQQAVPATTTATPTEASPTLMPTPTPAATSNYEPSPRPVMTERAPRPDRN